MNYSRLKICVIALILLAGAAMQVRAQETDEEYKVYDAVVRGMFRDGVTQFDMNAKVSKIVIRDHTVSEYASSLESENWEQVKNGIRELTDETIAGYEAARKDESNLKPKLDIPLEYALISDSDLRKFFPTEQGRTIEQWNEFYKLYPSSAGYNSFSKVGFDKQRKNALVYFINWCGPLCGTGTYVLVEKGENGWTVKNAAMMWIS